MAMRPNYIPIEQDTDDWRRWRAFGIGSSAAPIIMLEADKSPFALFQEYLGLRAMPYQNRFMARGKRLEPEARQAYTDQTGTGVVPACFEHPAFEYLRCSADGAVPTEAPSLIVEIKCPDKKVSHLSALEGTIPTAYWAQLQHLLMVSGADALDYASWWHGDLAIVEVKPDEEYIDRLMAAEHRFWRMVCDGRWVAPDGVKDMTDDQHWLQLTQRFKEIDALRTHYDELRKSAAAELAQYCGMDNERAFGNGVQVEWVHTVRAAEKHPRKAIDSWSLRVEQVPEKRVE